MHDHEYKTRTDDVQPASEITPQEIQRQALRLKTEQGSDITLEQRLAYLTSEAGDVAREVPKRARDSNGDKVRQNAGREW